MIVQPHTVVDPAAAGEQLEVDTDTHTHTDTHTRARGGFYSFHGSDNALKHM